MQRLKRTIHSLRSIKQNTTSPLSSVTVILTKRVNKTCTRYLRTTTLRSKFNRSMMRLTRSRRQWSRTKTRTKLSQRKLFRRKMKRKQRPRPESRLVELRTILYSTRVDNLSWVPIRLIQCKLRNSSSSYWCLPNSWTLQTLSMPSLTLMAQ